MIMARTPNLRFLEDNDYSTMVYFLLFEQEVLKFVGHK